MIPRAEALAEIMLIRRGIAVGGTHGKTTTTSIVASMFLHAGLDPTVVVGGRLDLFKSTAKLGAGEWLVAEADESDGSFLRLSPETVIITNIDNDHLEYYKSFENIQKAFYDFALRIPFYGTAIVCGDDLKVRKTFEKFPKKILFYGFKECNDYILRGEAGEFVIEVGGETLGKIRMPMPGRHNSLNALAAFITGQVAGLSIDRCIEGIEAFGGVDRRFQHKASFGDIEIYDDYGHHPTEVRAALQALCERFPNRRRVIVFEPHRFTRTRDCWNEFLDSFKYADKLFVLDIYPAGEKPIEGVTSQEFCQQIDDCDVEYLSNRERSVARIKEFLQPNDVCMTLGAGSVWKVGEELAASSQELGDCNE